MKESLAATFSEKPVHTSRNYLTEQGMGVVKWSENHKFLWLHSYIFILEIYAYFALIPLKGYGWTRYKRFELIRNI